MSRPVGGHGRAGLVVVSERKPYKTDLTDAQWAILEPLLPTNQPQGGRPWKDHCQVINGILWIKNTGTVRHSLV